MSKLFKNVQIMVIKRVFMSKNYVELILRTRFVT